MRGRERDFADADLRQLADRGMSPEDARRQLELLRRGRGTVRLARPCTPGDGIDTIAAAQRPELLRLQEEAALEGRFLKFVPASGIASRMFQDLAAFGEPCRRVRREELEARQRAGEAQACALLTFMAEIRRFPFFEDLSRALAGQGSDLERLVAEGPFDEVLAALIGPGGLGLAELPKGLLKFHGYGDTSRTAFEEHLAEAATQIRDRSGTCRLHFTVSPEHRSRFVSLLEEIRPRYERDLHARFEVGFSVQDPATDTLAIDLEGGPFRDESGRLLFRPGGHGALIGNLEQLRADVVHINNIDNIAIETWRPDARVWKKLLQGFLLKLQEELFRHVRRLEKDNGRDAVREALEFARGRLHLDLPEDNRQLLLMRLRRPLRVCGVVRNTGEPGGGPYWVQGDDGGASLQIVETSEVDSASEEQRAIARLAATHFNPVDLACGLRDADREPFDLRRYVDPDRVIVTRKTWGGRELLALERPGLWNGGMAGWITVFVEIPGETFTPVKTVSDLLRPEHQPA